MRTVYLGTSDFAATVLRRLADSEHRPQLVLTPPDSRRGRGRREQPPPVAALATELGLDLCQSGNVNEGEALERIRAARPEALVVCAFGQLIREPLLSEFEILNVHPSLLPRWRGAAPIERAIMAGDERTGVCIMRLTAGLDSGPVALCEEVALGVDNEFEAVSKELARLGGELLVRALDEAAAGTLTFAEQDEEAATYAEKIDPAERRLDPTRPAAELDGEGARADAPHRHLPGDGRRRSPRRSPCPRRRRRGQDRHGQGRMGGDAARLLPRRAAPRGRAAAGRQADAGRGLPPRQPAAEAALSGRG